MNIGKDKIMATVGTIKQFWRYTVKSTRGETVESTGITSTGIAGDRGWAPISLSRVLEFLQRERVWSY